MFDTNASLTPFPSRETRLDASDRNATHFGPTSKPPLIAGAQEAPFAERPPCVRESSRVLPGFHIWPRLSKCPRRRTTKTSLSPFTSRRTRFDASDSNAIARAQRRSPEITALVDGPFPCVICTVFWSFDRLEASVVDGPPAETATRPTMHAATSAAFRRRVMGYD